MFSINFKGLFMKVYTLGHNFFSSVSLGLIFSPIIIIINFPVTTTILGGEPNDFISVILFLFKQSIAFLAASLAGRASAKAVSALSLIYPAISAAALVFYSSALAISYS